MRHAAFAMPTFILTGVLLFIAAASSAHACNVPVFRYALERWEPDAFGALLFHKGPLKGEAAEAAANLEKRLNGEQANYNVYVQHVDRAEKLEGPIEQFWKDAGSPEDPYLVVQFPIRSELRKPAWSVPLTKANVDVLLESPVRRETARRILKGDSVVWLQLECGDKKKDDEIADMLETECKRLLTLVELPTPDDPEAKPLKAAFSVIRIAQNDPAETFLISALKAQYLASGENRDDKQGLVGPVFGQGRVLALEAAPAVTKQHMEDAIAFLTGACSCIVKEQNPGVDMLIGADWRAMIDKPVVVDKELPGLTDKTAPAGEAKTVEAKTAGTKTEENKSVEVFSVIGGKTLETKTAAQAPTAAAPEAKPGSMVSSLAVLAGVGVVVLIIASAFIMRGKKEF